MTLMMILTMTGRMNLREKVCIASSFIHFEIVISLNRSKKILGCLMKFTFNTKHSNKLTFTVRTEVA